MIQGLLDAGASPHWDWICETMREGHIALAEMLLQSGVERNIFTMAAMGDVEGITGRLRRVRADARQTADLEPASSSVTPLHVACASDWKFQGHQRMLVQTQVAMTLAEHDADLNALAHYRGIGGATPLFCACWSSENIALVRWLLDHGAAATDVCLSAALGHLQRHGRAAYDIADALVCSGLDVDCEDGTGRTLLQAFSHQGDHRTVAWLIAHGADVNAQSSSGRSAIHYAAERNTGLKTLALLVEAGADLLARDAGGRTPLEIAKLNGKTCLVEWITGRVSTDRQ
jgi:hypothetical protein